MLWTILGYILLFAAGFGVGAFVFRNNPAKGEAIASIIDAKFDELVEKVKEAIDKQTGK